MKGFKIINKFSIFKKDILFIILFTIIASFYYDSVLEKGPLNAHLWRQTDCLSLTHNYYKGANFFKPEMHILLADNNKTGVSVGEFPILYYTVGMIWKLFGESYFSYRLFYLLILFFGLFTFYKSILILFNNKFWAIVVSLLLFTSPVYVVYGVSFLTDVPAFSFILIALYFILQYHQKKAKKLFFTAMAFFALAGLIKVSSLIAFVFLIFILFIETFSVKSLGDKKLFNCKKYEWFGFISVILVIFSWYYYAEYFNALHGLKYTFNAIDPIWLGKKSELNEIANNITNFTSHVYFSTSILFVFLFLVIFNLFLWKRIPLFAYLSSITISFGCLIYFILWGRLMGVHDYYYSALLILFAGIILPFIWFIKSNYPEIFNGFLLKTFIIIFLSYNFIYCLSVVKLKTTANKGIFIIVKDHDFVGLMKWSNAEAISNWGRFERMKPYIKQIGIKDDDKIISLPDKSFSISLYLVNHKGWTDFMNYNKKEDIENLIHNGAKYLFISDDKLLKEEFLSPFITKQIGDYEGVKIFKLPDNVITNNTK